MCHQDAETQESRVWTTSACSRAASTASISSRSLARIDLSGLAHASDPGQYGIDIGSGIATISRFTLEFAVGGKVVVAVQTAVKLHESYRIQSARHEVAVRPIRRLTVDGASFCQHIPLEHAARFPASFESALGLAPLKTAQFCSGDPPDGHRPHMPTSAMVFVHVMLCSCGVSGSLAGGPLMTMRFLGSDMERKVM